MSDARSHDRQPEGDIDRLKHIEQLQRDMTLVMVHRDDRIELALGRFGHEGIDGPWTTRIDPKPLGSQDRRCDAIDLLGAEPTRFSGMGIQGRDGDSRWALATFGICEPREIIVGQFDRLENVRMRDMLEHLAQCHMQSHMDDTQAAWATMIRLARRQIKHHRSRLDAAQMPQEFCVTGP